MLILFLKGVTHVDKNNLKPIQLIYQFRLKTTKRLMIWHFYHK